MPYHLHIANKNYSSWSLRPWLLMRVHSIPFEEHLHPFQPGHNGRQPHWKSFSPTRHVPCLHDDVPSSSPDTDTTNPTKLVLWESLAIVDHLADAHPSLPIYPPLSSSPAARAWARSATAEMHASFSALRSEMSFNVGLRVELSSVSEQLSADLKRIDELWTEGLRTFGGPFLAGKEFGAVDAFYAPVVVRVQTFVGAVDFLGDEARGYMRTILAMPEMKEWTDAALRESWREGAHEEDTTLGRRIVEDLRTGVEAV